MTELDARGCQHLIPRSEGLRVCQHRETCTADRLHGESFNRDELPVALKVTVPNCVRHLKHLAQVSRDEFSQTPRHGDVRHFFARYLFRLPARQRPAFSQQGTTSEYDITSLAPHTKSTKSWRLLAFLPVVLRVFVNSVQNRNVTASL